MTSGSADPVTAFIVAAVVPRGSSHASGDTTGAERMLSAHPGVAKASIHTAAILGDDATVKSFIARDATNATAKGGPYEWDALTHLCFSNYLKHDRSRTDGFVSAATALLDAGASANTGWWEPNDYPYPQWEPALYGACGVAQHPEMTRLLLERGANPNDDEVVYHSPEGWDNAAMKILVETGKITSDNLSLMLIRKHDFHDYEGARYLLEHGADPNGVRSRGWYPMHHALARGNAIEMFRLLLDHQADPMVVNAGLTAVARAAREGRNDVLALFEERGINVALEGVDRLIAACARDDADAIRSITAQEPGLAAEALAMGGTLVAKFTGGWNAEGVRRLLDLGVPPTTPFVEGDGYFGIPEGSLPIHVAAWRAQPAIVKLLIERGSPVDVPDARGRTPLTLAVKACVDSYWTGRRTPESVRALLEAGASTVGVPYPSGYDEVDALLQARR